jgi:predicted metal-binding membrane protein
MYIEGILHPMPGHVRPLVLRALLFVGGAMNLVWIVALSIAVEELLPGCERIATDLGGLVRIGIACTKLLALCV